MTVADTRQARPDETPTWLGSAGFWLAAYGICGLVALIAANAGFFLFAGKNPLVDPNALAIPTLGLPVGLIVTNIFAVHGLLSLVAGVFAQATALLLCRTEARWTYLYTTLINIASALLAFLLFFPSAKEIVRTTQLDLEIQVDALLSAILVGFYLCHVVVLMLARSLAKRASLKRVAG